MRLILIWFLFFAYVGLMVYLYITVQSEEETPQQVFKPDTTMVIASDTTNAIADSLLTLVYQAYEEGKYEQALQFATDLEKRFPNTPQAEMASRLITAMNSSPVKKDTTNPTNTQPQLAAKTKTSTSVGKKVKKASTTKPSRSVTRKVTPAVKEKPHVKNVPPVLEEPQVQQVLARVKKVRDEENGITWYYNKNISHYVFKNSLEAYVGESDAGDVWLRLRIYYNGEKMLEIDNYEVYADDQIYTISVLTGNIERGKGVKGAWEWFDMQATEKEIAMISRLMNAERAVIRYIGKNGVFERAVGELEKLRLEYMLQLYRILTREQTLLTSNTGRK